MTVRDGILNVLTCPVCGANMAVNDGKSLYCKGGKTHSYDIAAAGYVNLCKPGQSGGGDSKQAVKARSEFLNKGYYRSVADELLKTLKRYVPNGGIVLDAGCGEEYYSSLLAEAEVDVFGVDISKFATEACAKRGRSEGKENVFFATASVFEVPIAPSSVDAVVNVFAPCAESEFSRVLKNGGVLIVVSAGERHLMGLKSAIYDTAHLNSPRADMPEKMEKIFETELKYSIFLDNNNDILSLFSMTPYYWRTSLSDAEKLLNIKTLDTEVDFMISVYKNVKEAEV
jgi:23S rRNA (guanine745-N1)-methyltransferase